MDSDPQIFNNCNFNKLLKVNLDQLPYMFFTFEHFFCFFQQKKTLHKIIFYKVFKAGPGSALKKQLDPDLQKMKADLQPCPCPM